MGYTPPAPSTRPNPSKSEELGLFRHPRLGTDVRDPVRDAPIRLNLDRFGLPKDFATYMWLVYHKVVVDESPERLAFLNGPDDASFGVQYMWR